MITSHKTARAPMVQAQVRVSRVPATCFQHLINIKMWKSQDLYLNLSTFYAQKKDGLAGSRQKIDALELLSCQGVAAPWVL